MNFKTFLKESIDLKIIASEILKTFESGSSMTRGPEEDGKQWTIEFRDWGTWESDYANHDVDDDDDGWDEDDDQQIMSMDTRKKLKSELEWFKSKYPTISLDVEQSEKNWVTIHIKLK